MADEGQELEIIAPGGSDIDLAQEYFSYFSSPEQPVTMRTPGYSVTARRIDYDRKRQELSAKGDVFLVSEEIEFRTGELLAELEEESFTATGGFTLTAGEMELTGRQLAGRIPEGILTATGEINWRYRDLRGEAEELVYRKDEGKVYLFGTPVAYWGENYMEGTMMVLHLETGRINITGPVKSKLQRQGGETVGD
jgi:lipopolysaccharide assembly outer membrane protein LptD (OstA)